MKGRIDVAGLRAIEEELPPLGGVIDLFLNATVDGWRYLLLVFEFDGDGAAWAASPAGAEKLPAVARHLAGELRKPRARGWTVTPVADQSALTPDEVKKLARLARSFGELIPENLPAGWGWGLLLYDPAFEVGRVWTSTCADEDEPAMLEEFARIREAAHDRPPGVVGREN